MPIAKPIGFDNFRTHFFVSNDGSGNKFNVKASFTFLEGALHKLFRGPNIVSTNAATAIMLTTQEAHDFHVGQTIRINGMPYELAALNAEWIILSTPSSTTFTVGFDSSSLAPTAGVGIAGVNTGSRIPSENFALVVGRLAVDEYPDPWELPLES